MPTKSARQRQRASLPVSLRAKYRRVGTLAIALPLAAVLLAACSSGQADTVDPVPEAPIAEPGVAASSDVLPAEASTSMAEEAAPSAPTHYTNVLPFSFQFTTKAGWTYQATVTALPALVTEKYVQDSPPGEAQLAQWFDGSFTWEVNSLDEGRNAPEHVLIASFVYDAGTSADDTHPDLRIIGLPVMCAPGSGERWVYGCSYDNEAVASSSSSPMLSHRITETQADALVNTVFSRDNALIHVGSPAAGECGVVVDPIAQTIEPNGFSAEKGTCSNLRFG